MRVALCQAVALEASSCGGIVGADSLLGSWGVWPASCCGYVWTFAKAVASRPAAGVGPACTVQRHTNLHSVVCHAERSRSCHVHFSLLSVVSYSHVQCGSPAHNALTSYGESTAGMSPACRKLSQTSDLIRVWWKMAAL